LAAQFIKHAYKHSSKFENKLHPGQRPLSIDDLKRIASVLDRYQELTVQPHGHNKTSVIYGRHFQDGKVEYVERVIETSEKHKPRLSTRTAWVKTETGVKSSPTRVYTPDRDDNLPFKDGRVNPDLVSKAVDENGEPMLVYHATRNNITTFVPAACGS
jgi:hypothetical protein